MKAKIKLILYAVIAILIGMPGIGGSAQRESVAFDDYISVNGYRLSTRGSGILEYLGFIDAYAGALYVEEGAPAEKALDDVAKRIEIEYFQRLDGEDFGPVTTKAVARNVDGETFKRLQDRIDYHNSLYVDVAPGDRYALTYTPGNGTVLTLNGNPLGVIEGADFASAIFAVWLGPEPLDASLRRQLLGAK